MHGPGFHIGTLVFDLGYKSVVQVVVGKQCATMPVMTASFNRAI